MYGLHHILDAMNFYKNPFLVNFFPVNFEFTVKGFNCTYNISKDDPILLISLLQIAPQQEGLRPDAATFSCDQRPQQYSNATLGICLAHGQMLTKIYSGIETFVNDHP